MPASADTPCDALVLFGATGDLAAKMIFPALARLQQRDGLALPVVAVGHKPIDAAALAARVRERIVGEAPALAAAFDAVASRVRYVHGDLAGAEVYAAIRDALGDARRPVHYLAVPPSLFEPVIRGLAQASLAAGARIAIEKPFGHDLASARALQDVVEEAFAEPQVWRIDHFLAKDPIRNMADMRACTAWLESLWSQQHVRSVQITMAEAFGIGTRGAFYEATGALRDVFQNHLLQLVALVAMEPVPLSDGERFSEARIAALRAIQPIAAEDIVYGQYEGYRAEADVAADSAVATYLAVRLHVDTPRFAGVPFYVRAGKRLAVTGTQLSLGLTRVRPLHGRLAPMPEEHLGFRLGPGEVNVTLDTHRLAAGSDARHERLLLGGRLPQDEDRDAYVNILHALVHGDRAIAERATGVTAAWRVVGEILDAPLPVHPYAQGSFGPAEADRLLQPGERWLEPTTA